MMKNEVPDDTSLSDIDISQRIKSAFELRGYSAIKTLLFNVEQGVVTVRGRLPSFYLCQVAIECVKHVPGVVRVINQIEVT
jgi:osmotically-inducible protein OsmY